MSVAACKEREREKKDVILDVCACCSQDQDGCVLGECLSMMSETVMCNTDVVLDLVNVDADVITIPPKKVEEWGNNCKEGIRSPVLGCHTHGAGRLLCICCK